MTLTKVKLTPTVDREGTRLSAEGAVYDSNFVRIRRGFFEKLYGWNKLSPNTYLGTCRALIMWTTNVGALYVGAGTHLKYYAVEGETFNDITPIRRSVTLGANSLETTSGSAIIVVTDAGHGAANGDYVTLSGVGAALNGIPAAEINAEHQITIVSSGSYTITVSTVATGPGAGGGASVVAEYQVNIGLNSASVATGYGAMPYSGAYFGVTTDTGWSEGTNNVLAATQLRLWSQDTFGEDLLLNPRGGGVYLWDASAGVTTRAVDLGTLSGALEVPTTCNQILVSEIDRHVVAYGCNEEGGSVIDLMLVRWSDQTTVTDPDGFVDWQARTDNNAGAVRLQEGSRILRAVRSREETLIFTNTALYAQRFVGPPAVFGFELLATSVSLIAPNAVTSTPVGVIWMSPQNFYIYNGTVKPIPCSVRNYIFSDINRVQLFKCFGGHSRAYNEAWFFYPSAGSGEVDRYVIWNYVEDGWTIGRLERTAWLDENLQTTFPSAAKAPYLYNHEQGQDDDGAAMNAYVETADFDYEDGEQFSLITRAIMDVAFSGTTQEGKLTVTARDAPGDTARNTAQVTITDTVQDVSPRQRGRQWSFKFESDTAGTGWRLGVPRFDVQPDGRN
jgi:hypothetical protein